MKINKTMNIKQKKNQIGQRIQRTISLGQQDLFPWRAKGSVYQDSQLAIRL